MCTCPESAKCTTDNTRAETQTTHTRDVTRPRRHVRHVHCPPSVRTLDTTLCSSKLRLLAHSQHSDNNVEKVTTPAEVPHLGHDRWTNRVDDLKTPTHPPFPLGDLLSLWGPTSVMNLKRTSAFKYA